MKAYRILGTTDDVTTCDLCGRDELKGTVVLVPLDVDGNEDGEVSYFGTSCAAKAAGWTVREVNAGVKAAKDEERERQRAERDAMWAAEREFLAGWYLEHYGTSDLREAADRAGMSPVRLSGEAIHAYRETQRAAEAAPSVDETPEVATTPAPAVNFRETVLTVASVSRTVRTEQTGTVKQLEAAHTKAVKSAIVEMRRANLDGYNRAAVELEARPWFPLKDLDVKRAQNIARRAERGTLYSHGTPGVDVKPFPKVKFTETAPEYLVEIEPGHYATAEAAEQLTLS